MKLVWISVRAMSETTSSGGFRARRDIAGACRRASVSVAYLPLRLYSHPKRPCTRRRQSPAAARTGRGGPGDGDALLEGERVPDGIKLSGRLDARELAEVEKVLLRSGPLRELSTVPFGDECGWGHWH